MADGTSVSINVDDVARVILLSSPSNEASANDEHSSLLIRGDYARGSSTMVASPGVRAASLIPKGVPSVPVVVTLHDVADVRLIKRDLTTSAGPAKADTEMPLATSPRPKARPQAFPALLHLLLTLLLLVPAAAASSVGDRCSADEPCTPSAESDALFCDFRIGPEAGGYCELCGEGDEFCRDAQLIDLGHVDCREKCAFTNCTLPCEEGQYCSYFNHVDGPCQACTVVHPDECEGFPYPAEGKEACKATCPPRSCKNSRHCISYVYGMKFFCNMEADVSIFGEDQEGTCEPCTGLKSIDQCADRGRSELANQECASICEEVVVTSCAVNGNKDCANKVSHFCDDTTTCQLCPSSWYIWDWHVDKCFNPEYIGLSDQASKSCAESCQTECQDDMHSSISIEGLIDYTAPESLPMVGTIYKAVSGPLVDCQFGGPGECPADAPQDFVCLVSRGMRTFVAKVINCEEAGAIAVIIYNNQEDGSIVRGGVGGAPIEIPITAISMQDGHHMQEKALGLATAVDVTKLGDYCKTGCSDRVPCPLSSAGSAFCNYISETHGYCDECLEDKNEQRLFCFLSGLSLRGAQECAAACNSTLAAPSCKICGKDVSGSSLMSASGGEARCEFCPGGLQKSYYDREIPFVGRDATCFNLNQFFLNYNIAEDDSNCQLALSFNYICGCNGPGYAGANTDKKRKALVWVPRVSGILSFCASLSIIFDVVRDRGKRRNPQLQLIVAMSIFDLFGSAAYSFASLPIPKMYYVEGSTGNDSSCEAQGFFIQMGTVAAFINVSLAVFYFCKIKLAWGEARIGRLRRWFFLCPVILGLLFAFAGIPYYDMLFLWCNNTAAWWPDIPVAVAIFVVTLLMLAICHHVYKTERATRAYNMSSRTGTVQQSMTTTVFWSSVWYLLAFYVTWVPYLVLQYFWAAGTGYSSYGFVLAACTLVPMQGFWNSAVYFRKRFKKWARETRLYIWLSRARAGGDGRKDRGSTGDGNTGEEGA